MDRSLINGIERGRQKAYDFSPTPLPVIRQGLEQARRECPQLERIKNYLDPGAGAGAFGEVVRQLWSPRDVVSIAIEPLEEMRPHLKRHYNAIFTGYFQAFSRSEITSALDLIATNPKFELWPELVPWSLDRLADDGVLLLYGRTYWGHSEEPAERSDLFKKYPPSFSMRVAGRVRHLVGINDKGKPFGTDSHKYSWWCWDKANPGEPGRRVQIDLPQLLPNERRFTVIPGMPEGES